MNFTVIQRIIWHGLLYRMIVQIHYRKESDVILTFNVYGFDILLPRR